MANQKAAKTQKLVEYIVRKNQQPTVTSIIKLCYLIDLANFRKQGEQITDFHYIRYNYGPFDRTIYTILEDLEKSGRVISEPVYYGPAETVLFKPTDETISKLDDPFSDSEREIIDGILDDFQGYGAKLLTDVAYKTGPMKALKATQGGSEGMGQALDLSKSG